MRPAFLGVVGLLAGWCVAAVGRSAAEEPLRIVPQLAWNSTGIASTDSSLLAACEGFGCGHSVKLVSRHGELLWTIPLYQPRQAAFSADGKWLAGCGSDQGFLLELKSCTLRFFPVLRGAVIGFTSDSRRVLVVRDPIGRFSGLQEREEAGLYVYDLEARPVGHFPVAMDVPSWVEVPADGKTVRVHGAHGNPQMHVPRMGKAEETIHLDTGATERDWGPAQRGEYRVSDPDPRQVKAPPIDAKKTLRHDCPQGLRWNETSGFCVQYGYRWQSMPFLPDAVAWDIRRGRFLRGCGRQLQVREVGGFLGPETILAYTGIVHHDRLSLVDLRTGQTTPTGVAALTIHSWPSPDGKSFFACTEAGSWRWELHHLPQRPPVVLEQGLDRNSPYLGGRLAWSGDGHYLAYLRPQTCLAARRVAVADDNFEDFPLADVVPESAVRSSPAARGVWALELDGTGKRLAVASGSPYRVAVIDCHTRQVVTTLDGFSIWAQALRFVGPDRLLTGTMQGCVQLWDLARRQPLWTTEIRQDCREFGYNSGAPHVACGNLFRSGTVLRISDGTVVYRTTPLWTGGSSEPLGWTQPQLIGRGA